MKKAITLSALMLAVSSNVIAQENKDKRGFGLSIGYSSFVSGDLNELDGSPFTIGGNYTLKNGVLIGFDFTPNLIDDSDSVYILGENIHGDIETSLFTPYIGFELQNGLRVMGGVTFANSEATLSSNHDSVSEDETTAGLMAGLGYVANNGFTVDGKLSFVDVGGFDGVVSSVSIGYKF